MGINEKDKIYTFDSPKLQINTGWIPKYSGSYVINDGLSIAFKNKPNFLHRFFTRLLLGWVWVDKKEED